MSEQRQVRHADRRSPIRHAVPTRRSSSGPGDRIASAGQIATYFREDCRTLRDSLQLEMVAAQYHLRFRDLLSPEEVPVGEAVAAGVVAELERHGDQLSHAILRALAYLGTDGMAERSAHAAARLSDRGVGLPARFGDVAGARALGAWCESERGFTGEYAFFIDFEYGLGVRHALALFVEPRSGGVIKHIGLMQPMTELDSDDPFHPSALDPIEIVDAGALLGKLLDRSFGSRAARTDDYRILIASARARSMGQERAAAAS